MRRERGFTLIELLIVVAIIGIIAAIAIPNLLNALNRGRQKRTMADMRTIGTAIESYNTDFNFYPKIASGTVTALDPYLTPTYERRLPPRDGWNNEMYYIGDVANGLDYTILSYAKDNISGAIVNGRRTTDFNDDIVFSDGMFSQWPEGLQQ
jgi:general secretion pathway protein G